MEGGSFRGISALQVIMLDIVFFYRQILFLLYVVIHILIDVLFGHLRECKPAPGFH